MNAQALQPQQILQLFNDLQKAVTVTPVSGLNVVREDLQSQLVLAAPIDTPLRNRLNRIKGNGKAHAYYRLERTDTPLGPFLGTSPLNGYFSKGNVPTSSDAKYNYVAVPYVNVGDLAQVTFQDVAEGASYFDLLGTQVKIKMFNTGMMEEWGIINGNSAVYPLTFDGLDAQIADVTSPDPFKNVIDYAAFVPKDPNFKLLEFVARMCKEITYAGGTPRLFVASYGVKEQLTNQISQRFFGLRQMNGVSLGQIGGGFEINSWNFGWGPVELIAERYLQADAYGKEKFFVLDHLTQDNRNIEGGNVIQMVDLTAIGAVDLALLATAWRRLVYESTALMIAVPQFQRKAINFS